MSNKIIRILNQKFRWSMKTLDSPCDCIYLYLCGLQVLFVMPLPYQLEAPCFVCREYSFRCYCLYPSYFCTHDGGLRKHHFYFMLHFSRTWFGIPLIS
ncbi:unnamed protein product [Allacma fusca]|uniref:Uncharacterized protein n=1 Tax=Allacma fusca TaxID=39272 RepID=A0A8J2P9G3_9HEXA|nr:unnamed protein product [Allacma fusca]